MYKMYDNRKFQFSFYEIDVRITSIWPSFLVYNALLAIGVFFEADYSFSYRSIYIKWWTEIAILWYISREVNYIFCIFPIQK